MDPRKALDWSYQLGTQTSGVTMSEHEIAGLLQTPVKVSFTWFP